nr:ceramidase [Hymenolepis microstoma]
MRIFLFNLLAIIVARLLHITDGLLIGAGKFDITGPVVEVDFMGYGEFSQTGKGLHLRLYSRAFIFQADAFSKPVLFISLDAGMVSQLMKTQLVRLLQEEYGKEAFDHKNVMISATHTHSGPGGYFQYLLYDITTFGFSNDTFATMTKGNRIASTVIMSNLVWPIALRKIIERISSPITPLNS